jgi:hypothetical protein
MPANLRREVVDGDKFVRTACETGRAGNFGARVKAPDIRDVLYSLSMDADVLESASFEDWASNFGYDADSRKAEGIYQACLKIALQLRQLVGDAGLAQLREAFQDY